MKGGGVEQEREFGGKMTRKPATYQILLIGRLWGQLTPCWCCVSNIVVERCSVESPQILEKEETGKVFREPQMSFSDNCTAFYRYTREKSLRKL